MLRAKEPTERTTLTLDELQQMQTEVQTLDIPDLILNRVTNIRLELHKKNIVASDRRYRQSLKLLQALAYLNGRPTVAKSELFFLEHVLWKDPGERIEVHNVIHELDHGYEDEVQALLVEARVLHEDYAERIWDSKEQRARGIVEVDTKIRRLLAKVQEIGQKARDVGRPLEEIETVKQEIQEIQRQLLTKL